MRAIIKFLIWLKIFFISDSVFFSIYLSNNIRQKCVIAKNPFFITFKMSQNDILVRKKYVKE